MIRLLLVFMTLGLFVNNSICQENEYNRQLGVDASKFLSQFLSFGDSNNNLSPYFILLKKYKGDKNIRYGLGGNLNLRLSDARSLAQIDFKIGSERFIDFGKHWRGLYGLDTKYGINAIFSNNGNNAIGLRMGIAPFLGIQFRINERLSIATETAYNLWIVGEFQEDVTDFRINTVFEPPLSILFQFDFYKKNKDSL